MEMTVVLRVGDVTIDEPVVLAPMAGVTDLPFRRLVKGFGVGLVVSEMIASQAMIRQTRQSMKMSTLCHDEHPMAVQIAGGEPEVMAEAARLNADRGAAIIDINFGCPVKKVVNTEAGSALMRDERHAARIMSAVVEAVDLPVTVKMRTGWNQDHRNAPSLARIAEDCGVRMVTVHGRTRCQLYNGRADWDFLAEVKDGISIPLIANGDIVTEADARDCLSRSGADGVMIGRGTYGRPWFPAQVAHFLRHGTHLDAPPLDAQLAVLLEHYDAMIAHYGVPTGVRIARKHIAWYSKGLPGSAQFRARINAMDDPVMVRDAIHAFYGSEIERLAA